MALFCLLKVGVVGLLEGGVVVVVVVAGVVLSGCERNVFSNFNCTAYLAALQSTKGGRISLKIRPRNL